MPANLFDLYEEMRTDGTSFFDYDTGDSLAATLYLNGQYGIFLNSGLIESEVEEKCVVAHEMGHCATGTTHAVCSTFDLVERHEYKANKWAIQRILPLSDLREVIQSGRTEIWELAEYFEVTEDFALLACKMYGLVE